MKHRISSFLLVAGILLGAARSNAIETSAELLGKFRNTYYYIIIESEYAHHPVNAALLTMDDEVLAQVSTPFKKALTIEGTGLLLDGRVVNFSGRKNGENRYRVTPNRHGDGVGTCALIPFHTIAVDPSRIPLGSLVLIEETRGMLLPDGSVHDGLWRAEDVGGAIKGDRIDLFVGAGNQGEVLTRHGITHLEPLTIRMITPPQPDNCTGRPFAQP